MTGPDGQWCPYCARKVRLGIGEMQELARQRGGVCLSKRYVNTKTPLRWQCAEGHVWSATPNSIKPSGYKERGTWCPICARRSLYSLGDMQQLAAEHGGKCLSTQYINCDTPLKWQCANVHIWKAAASRTRAPWCTACRREKLRNLGTEAGYGG